MKKILLVLSIILISGCSPHKIDNQATIDINKAKNETVIVKNNIIEFEFNLLDNIKLIHEDKENKLLIYSTLENYEEYQKQLDMDGNVSFSNNGKANVREFIVLYVNYESIDGVIKMDFKTFKENVLKSYQSNNAKYSDIKDEDGKFLSLNEYNGLVNGYVYVSGFNKENKYVFTTLISNLKKDTTEKIALEIYNTMNIK